MFRACRLYRSRRRYDNFQTARKVPCLLFQTRNGSNGFGGKTPITSLPGRDDRRVNAVARSAALRGVILRSADKFDTKMEPAAYIVVHYHELWLKQGNRRFFLHKLRQAMRNALSGLSILRITQPGDRYVIETGEASQTEEALRRLTKVSGISHFGVGRAFDWRGLAPDGLLPAICAAAWEEIRDEKFSTFAVRVKRSYKPFPLGTMEMEREIGGEMYDRLHASGRSVRVDLEQPELTCRIEVTRGPMLVYGRRIAGPGGLPANTAGRMTCLLSGGFDSAVAAYKMMRRGAHVNFVHFWGGGADAGESSVHVVRQLVDKLVPWQTTAKLYLVPFESLQREIVREAQEKHRILLYRRLMLRIAERISLRERGKGLITGDSLGQVASQTAQNLYAVGAAARLAIYRPLIGDDKLEIQELARKIGTYAISEEQFHDCCPVFLPKSPELHADPAELANEETKYGMTRLVERGLASMTVEKYRWTDGKVERQSARRKATA